MRSYLSEPEESFPFMKVNLSDLWRNCLKKLDKENFILYLLFFRGGQ